MRKYLLLLLFTFAGGCTLKAQQYRQIDKNLDVFYKLNPGFKISLFFNQPCYMAGDTAYFLARYVNEVDLRPVKKKAVLHLSLVSENGLSAHDQFFIVEDGIAANQLVIPSALPLGIYRLQCFREPINASGKELFYQQTFEIVGDYKRELVDTIRLISIFPEGGTILEGKENKVFVSVRPKGSWPLKVLDEANNEVSRFKTNTQGIGFFSLSPNEGQTFHVTGKVAGKALTKEVPNSKKVGINFSSSIDNGKLKLAGVTLGVQGFPEIILVKNDRVCYAEKLKLSPSDTFSFDVSLGEILTGLFQLWIVDKNTVLASRSYYNAGHENDLLKINHPLRAHPRQKIELRLTKNDSLIKGNFSVRIYQKALFAKSTRNIFSNLELFDNLPAGLNNDDFPVDSINDFIATQSWPRYHLDSLVKGMFKVRKVNFDPPYSIKGRCVDLSNPTQQPVRITLYFENSNFIEEVFLDKQGNFSVELTQPISLTEKVYYRVTINESEIADAKVEIKTSNKALHLTSTRITKESNPYFSYRSVMNSAERSFRYFSNQSRRGNLRPERLIGLEKATYGADNVDNMKDYLTFPTMKDVIVEILPKVALRKIGTKNVVRIYLEERAPPKINSVLSKKDPLFIIDGTPTSDVDFFLSLKPSNIEWIKVIWKVERSVLKSFGANGVIIVETKDPTLTGQFHALNSFNLSGFSPSLTWKESDQLTEKRTPYFKSCQYWNPNIEFYKDGVSVLSFFASDDLGEYVVEIEGLTPDGTPYFHQSSFLVIAEK